MKICKEKQCEYYSKYENHDNCSLLRRAYYEIILQNLSGMPCDYSYLKEKYHCPYYVEIFMEKLYEKEINNEKGLER